jgi:hypothetical protein
MVPVATGMEVCTLGGITPGVDEIIEQGCRPFLHISFGARHAKSS